MAKPDHWVFAGSGMKKGDYIPGLLQGISDAAGARWAKAAGAGRSRPGGSAGEGSAALLESRRWRRRLAW